MKSILFCSVVLSASMAVADVSFEAGRWNVSFVDDGAKITLTHADGFAEVSGALSFEGPAKVTGAGIGKDESMAAWRVVSPRDGFSRRLALVDTRDNVNGYITFQTDGEGITMLVYHRTAFAYVGKLSFAHFAVSYSHYSFRNSL